MGYVVSPLPDSIDRMSFVTADKALATMEKTGPMSGLFPAGSSVTCSLVMYTKAGAGPTPAAVKSTDGHPPAIGDLPPGAPTTVWIVALTGLAIPAIGPTPGFDPDSPKATTMEWIANAQTGAYIEALAF